MFDHLNKSYIKTECQNNFEVFGDKEVEKCQKDKFSFCKRECQKIVNPIEQVKSHNCYKNCNKALEAEKRMMDAARAMDKKESGFKKGQKVDYKPKTNCAGVKNESNWVEAYISNVIGEGAETKIDLAYEYCGEKKSEKSLPYPNERVDECAKHLKTRTNCKELVKL